MESFVALVVAVWPISSLSRDLLSEVHFNCFYILYFIFSDRYIAFPMPKISFYTVNGHVDICGKKLSDP